MLNLFNILQLNKRSKIVLKKLYALAAVIIIIIAISIYYITTYFGTSEKNVTIGQS